MMSHDLLSRARLYADRAEWLAARPGQDQTSIGASEVANILGIGFRTPFEFWASRTQGEPDEDIDGDLTPESEDGEPPPTSPLERGNRWEPVVIDEYNAVCAPRRMTAAGAFLGHPGALVTVQHPTIAWATASPDAFTVDDGDIGGGECKTSIVPGRLWGSHGTVIPNADAFDEAILPGCYYTQCQWQCACLDVPFVDLAVLLGSYRLRSYRILRDDSCIRQLVDHVGAWRERHLVRGEAPPIDGSDGARAWLSRRFAAVKGSERAATPEEAETIAAFAVAKSERRAAEEREAQLRNEIALAMGAMTKLYIPGTGRGVNFTAAKNRAMTVYGF